MFHFGRTRHPGLGPLSFPPVQLPVEFVNVDGGLTCGDLALDSCAQFLAVAEHRFIPSRHGQCVINSVGLVVILCGLLLARIMLLVVMLGSELLVLVVLPQSLPSLVTPQFQEFFRLGRVLRTILPTGKGGVVHLFVVYGYRWLRRC